MHADIDTVKVVVKNVPDYAAGKEKNDLGFLTFDLQVRILICRYCLVYGPPVSVIFCTDPDPSINKQKKLT